jgi:hypothetical protein
MGSDQLCSYVMLQGLGIMPLQLVQLAVIIPNLFYRLFITRTPRGVCGRCVCFDLKLARPCRAQCATDAEFGCRLPAGHPDFRDRLDLLGHHARHPHLHLHLLWHGIVSLSTPLPGAERDALQPRLQVQAAQRVLPAFRIEVRPPESWDAELIRSQRSSMANHLQSNCARPSDVSFLPAKTRRGSYSGRTAFNSSRRASSSRKKPSVSSCLWFLSSPARSSPASA